MVGWPRTSIGGLQVPPFVSSKLVAFCVGGLYVVYTYYLMISSVGNKEFGHVLYSLLGCRLPVAKMPTGVLAAGAHVVVLDSLFADVFASSLSSPALAP